MNVYKEFNVENMERCYSLLSEQFSSMCEKGLGERGRTVYETRKYSVQDSGTTFIVFMTREKNQTEVPQGVTLCGGKLVKDTVAVVYTVKDNKVNQLLIDYFKNKKNEPIFGPPTNRFDEIVIDDEKIR